MTFEELKAAMGTWLDCDQNRLPNETRGQIINICQRELLRVNDLRYGEAATTFPTVVGTDDYALPTGWSRPYSLWFYSTGKHDLDFLNKEEFDIKYPNPATTGSPLHYTVWGEKIYIGPTPNAIVTVNANYMRVLPDLADGTPLNTNDLVAGAWEVLFFRALWYASEFMIEDSRSQMWAAKAQMLEQKLALEHARARSSGRRPIGRDYGYTGGPSEVNP